MIVLKCDRCAVVFNPPDPDEKTTGKKFSDEDELIFRMFHNGNIDYCKKCTKSYKKWKADKKYSTPTP